MPKKPSRLPHRTNSERLSTAVTRSFTMSGMTGFLVAVGGFSLICFWLMTRTQNIGARRSSHDGSGSDASSYSGSSSGTGWSLSSWFGGVPRPTTRAFRVIVVAAAEMAVVAVVAVAAEMAVAAAAINGKRAPS